MIRPKPKPGLGAPRAVAVVVTGLVLVGAQIALEGTAVPAFASGRDLIRELDPLLFQRFATPPAPEVAPEAAEEEDLPEEVVEEAPAVSFEEEVGQAMEQLERRFAAEPEAASTESRDGAAAVSTPGIDDEATNERFESLFGASDAGVAVGGVERTRPSGRTGAGVGLGIAERTGDSTGARPAGAVPAGPAVAVETAADREESAGAEVEVRPYESESFDGSEAGRLARWMRENPSGLPVGVRVHVNYDPTFLTATADFSSLGRDWEVYLMFNESLRELHIVLVDGARSVYMIDRGFQEQSRSLREGTVRRTNGQIVAVDSRTGAASSERAREFYNVFLSWWEAEKGDGGTG